MQPHFILELRPPPENLGATLQRQGMMIAAIAL
jgi:hypothetical protein